MDIIRPALIGAAPSTFMALAAGSTYAALSLRPAFIPLIFLLSLLINYLRATVKRPGFTHRYFTLLSALSAATLAAYSSSTLSALSTRFLSAGVLLGISFIFCFVALAPIIIYARTRAYVGSRSGLSGLLLFPALWVTTWSLFVRVSPLGRIGTWSPMTGIESYSWITPIFGQAGIDFVTALWAVLVAEFIGDWVMGSEAREHLPEHVSPNIDFLTPITHQAEDPDTDPRVNNLPYRRQHRNPSLYLLGLLLFSIIPSYREPILPLPTHSQNTTELTVSCVHPYIHTPGTPLSLEDYLAETRTQASRAKVVLWPEGAVRFHSDLERTDAFKAISLIANTQNAWIGVGYEQHFSESNEKVLGQRVRGHNGLVIFGPKMQPVTYIKQKLVPLVESFSFESSASPPPRYPMYLPAPKHFKGDKSSWPRTIPITSAICLDVSAPLVTSVPVNQTDLARPALILAPARTWHPEIGKAMFQHASMRAIEQGASILWCDGGEGGVSGVGGLAAQGLGLVGGIGQVGTGGSWMQTIGIPFPYDAHTFTPTWYARWGDLSILFLAWALLSLAPMMPVLRRAGHLMDLVRRARLQGDERSPQRNEATPLLIDT